MTAFFGDMASNPFLLTGLLASVCASVACGTVGPYLVARRLVFLAGALAHIAVGGIGAAIYLAHALPGSFGELSPTYGGVAAAVLAAPLLAWLRHRAHERLDTVVGALWATGMAVGILLLKLTPGYHTEILSYLFGNLAFVSREQVGLLAVLAAVAVSATILFHRRFLALCLDSRQAGLQGVSVIGTEAVLLTVVALTVLALTQVVGLVLVLALLTLPAASAGRLVHRVAPATWLATGLCLLVTTVPRVAVYGTPVSPEAAIVLAAAAVYVLVLLVPRDRWGPRGPEGE